MNEPNPIESYTEAETQRRAEAALKRMLTTPHRPHEASGKRRKESSQSK
jgi:hypothetical protein